MSVPSSDPRYSDSDMAKKPSIGDSLKMRPSEMRDSGRPRPDPSDATVAERADLEENAAACVHDLIAPSLAANSSAHALEFEGAVVTYEELDRQSNRLAHLLVSMGVGPDVRVATCIGRSFTSITALVAILKAGGAYVALDPAYPIERLNFMLEDSGASVLLADRETSELFRNPRARALCLEANLEVAEEWPATQPIGNVTSESAAYVIYTSGSSGKPKGIVMPHRPLVNLMKWQASVLPGAARTLQFAPLSFDVSFQEIFTTLSSGGTLVLISDEARRDPEVLWRTLGEESIERLFLPFVALQQLAVAEGSELPAQLRHVITAGEQLRVTPQIKRLFERLPGCRLHNQYGPSETHVATAFTLSGSPDSWPALPPIGQPISNATALLLDDLRNPVADGNPGELCLGGDCVSRGYLDRPELTVEKYIFSSAGERIYRTGDLARRLPSGDLEFLGRADDQIKVRGHRVELGEIEAVLTQHPAVNQAAVRLIDDATHGLYLVAYLVSNTPSRLVRKELREFLNQTLPDYMLPTTYVVLPSLPLTPSGKVDRRALPGPSDANVLTLYRTEIREVRRPSSDWETRLVEIWEAALGKRPIGILDNFFELGGHSLLAVQICAEIEKKFRKKVPVATFFRAPTIESFARALSLVGQDNRLPALEEFQALGSRPPFFCAPGFVDLARCLGDNQPFYGLNLDLLYRMPDVETGIQDWAKCCIEEIKQVQPQGPYFLGGSSGAAVMALEIAHQLQALGEVVALVAFFDPIAPSSATPMDLAFKLGRYSFHLSNLLKLGWKQGARYLVRVTGVAVVDFSARLRARIDPPTRRVIAMEAKYRHPEQYSGRMVLFLSQDSYLRHQPAKDPRLTWRRIAPNGFELHEISGRHDSYMREPYVKKVANLLRACIQRSSLPAALIAQCFILPV